MIHKTPTILTILAALLAIESAAAPLTGWRGDSTGRYPEAQPPQTWSKDSNVVWKTKLPGWSNASPLILGDRLYVCAEPATLICVALKDGAILWTRSNTYLDVLPASEVEKVKADRARAAELRAKMKPLNEESRKVKAALKKTPDDADLKARAGTLKASLDALEAELKQSATYADPETHSVNGFSTPTPTTDGTDIYATFGNGVVSCHDAEGNRKWARFIEKPTHGWGHSASPLLVDGKLIVHILKVTALDPSNGATVWQTESSPAWGSEVQARIGNVAVVITPAGDFIRVSDGRMLASKVSKLTYCAPVVSDGIVYFIEHGGKAVRLPATAGDTITPEILWETKPKNDRYYASPVVHDGLVYAVNQVGLFSAIDAANGQVVYEQKLDLGNVFYPSVTLAGGFLYVSSDNGKTVVVQPGREYREVARNALEPFRSSPVFVGTRAYVRGTEYLWCLGK